MGRDFELSDYQGPSGWNFTFRAYNLVSFSAPIWGCVKKGGVVGVQKLFKERSASPFDKSPTGDTLLDIHIQNYSSPFSFSKYALLIQIRQQQQDVDSLRYAAF